MKIAVVTPWPPQITGIADYSYDLVGGLLQQGHNVTVISEISEPKQLEGVKIALPNMISGSEMKQFDKIVYQLGNNSSFHLFQLPLLMKFPGVIHLHDMVLHHLMAYLLYIHGSISFYRRVLSKWYGPEISKLAVTRILDIKSEVIWDSPDVVNIPFFEEVLQYASGCITHSQFAKKKVERVFPNLKCQTIAQVYSNMNIKHAVKRKTLSIGVFGGVSTNKRLDIVLRALAKCKIGVDAVELNIIGTVDDNCLVLRELTTKLELDGIVNWHGRLDETEFLNQLHSTDLCISLRSPTMGEVSAIVMRACQSAIPVIVSDIGWYSELPDFISKIKPGTETEIDELANLIQEFMDFTESTKKIYEHARSYALNEFNFEKTIKRYVEILQEITS